MMNLSAAFTELKKRNVSFLAWMIHHFIFYNHLITYIWSIYWENSGKIIRFSNYHDDYIWGTCATSI